MEAEKQYSFEFEQYPLNYQASLWPWWRQWIRSVIPTLMIIGLLALGIYWKAMIPLLLLAILLSYVSFKIKGRRFHIRFRKPLRVEALEFPFRLNLDSSGIEILDRNGKSVNEIPHDEIEEVRFYPEFVCIDYRRLDSGMPDTLELSEAQFPNESWEKVRDACGPTGLGDFDDTENP